MKTWNKNEIARLILDAGRIALTHFDSSKKSYKSDDSIVTQADTEIEGMLEAYFDIPEEDTYLVGEETLAKRSERYLAEAFKHTAWIIDPVDGTSSYAHRLPSWGVSIAYSEKGRIREGALYLPIGGELLLTEGDRVYYGRVRPDAENPGEDLKPCALPSVKVEKGSIVTVAQEYLRNAGPVPFGTVHATGSCVFSMVHLILGNYVAYIADAGLWDFAAGLSVMEKLGIKSRLEDGFPFTTSIDSRQYSLAPDSAKRFKTKGRALFAVDDAAMNYLLSNLSAAADGRTA